MADIVVVGGGVAGMSAAARLAKLKHRVTLVERSEQLGGALKSVSHEGFSWAMAPTSIMLPAVLRDLFRKSGRPLEQHIELEVRSIGRRHLFGDGSVVDLPTGSRGAQLAAVDAGLGAGFGLQWSAYVDGLGARWDVLRNEVLDRPLGGQRLTDRRVRADLGGGASAAKLVARALRDERLRLIATHSVRADGSSPRSASAASTVAPYVERSFGLWDPVGGLAALLRAFQDRLGERGVDVRLATEVIAVDDATGRARGVITAAGEHLLADIVVTAVDPRRVVTDWVSSSAAAGARSAFGTATPALPPVTTHLGLVGAVPDLPPETVYHGDPEVVVTRDGTAPAGACAWTAQSRGGSGEDVLSVLARRGLDLRDRVSVRVDRSPADIVTELGGSPFGLTAEGWRAEARRAAHLEPLPGLHLTGAGTHPGAALPYAAWRAAHVAELIGPA